MRKGRICGTGFNGAPPGLPHCTEVGCGGGEKGPQTGSIDSIPVHEVVFPHGCTRAVHAEANAVAYSARHGISTEGATVYCTHSPCIACAQLLVSSGIVRLVFADFYRIKDPLEWLDQVMEVHHAD